MTYIASYLWDNTNKPTPPPYSIHRIRHKADSLIQHTYHPQYTGYGTRITNAQTQHRSYAKPINRRLDVLDTRFISSERSWLMSGRLALCHGNESCIRAAPDDLSHGNYVYLSRESGLSSLSLRVSAFADGGGSREAGSIRVLIKYLFRRTDACFYLLVEKIPGRGLKCCYYSRRLKVAESKRRVRVLCLSFGEFRRERVSDYLLTRTRTMSVFSD